MKRTGSLTSRGGKSVLRELLTNRGVMISVVGKGAGPALGKTSITCSKKFRWEGEEGKKITTCFFKTREGRSSSSGREPSLARYEIKPNA